MGGDLAVGTGVAHPRYGQGEVVGFGAGRKSVRVRFAEGGARDLPYPCDGLAAADRAGGAGEARSLTLGLDGRRGGGPGCRWLMQFTGAPMLTLVHDINTWANSRARVADAAVNFTALGQGRMELRITGSGRDGRCRWCRTFRSGLRTAVRREYGPQAFVLGGRCVFDEPTASAEARGEGGAAAQRP